MNRRSAILALFGLCLLCIFTGIASSTSVTTVAPEGNDLETARHLLNVARTMMDSMPSTPDVKTDEIAVESEAAARLDIVGGLLGNALNLFRSGSIASVPATGFPAIPINTCGCGCNNSSCGCGCNGGSSCCNPATPSCTETTIIIRRTIVIESLSCSTKELIIDINEEIDIYFATDPTDLRTSVWLNRSDSSAVSISYVGNVTHTTSSSATTGGVYQVYRIKPLHTTHPGTTSVEFSRGPSAQSVSTFSGAASASTSTHRLVFHVMDKSVFSGFISS